MITISKAELEMALLEWERAYREGETMTYEESLKLPAEEIAKMVADQLWDTLKRNQRTPTNA